MTVTGVAPFGSVDQVVDSSTGSTTVSHADNLLVRGWAADIQDNAPVKQVQILVDGTAIGNATLGGARPDVATALNNAAYTNSGWTFTYAALSLSVGTHTVSVVATDSVNLTTTIGSKSITVTGVAPFGSVDQAVDSATGLTTVSHADNLLVRGWAADIQDNAPVKPVLIMVDGTAIGNATLGGSRPDVATALNNAAYTNSGWTLTYAASGFSVGPHTVTVVATDSLSLSTTIGAKSITVQ